MACRGFHLTRQVPSMKVPPKRKGNEYGIVKGDDSRALNESPSEKEGKSGYYRQPELIIKGSPSMKVPPKRKGNLTAGRMLTLHRPSMKVPPKRKGNPIVESCGATPEDPQ